jgi:hypothetical protein
MNGRPIDSNVYYLPVPTPEEPEPRLERASTLRRWRNAWWRLRVAVAEIRAILKSRPRYSPQDYSILLDAADPLVRARERRRPARIIDFEMARLRLRTAAEA